MLVFIQILLTVLDWFASMFLFNLDMNSLLGATLAYLTYQLPMDTEAVVHRMASIYGSAIRRQ